MTVRFILAAGLAVSALAASGPAAAQLSETDGPISYSANNLEYFDGDRRLVLTGDVDIVQNDARLRASSVTLFFAPGQGGQTGLASGDIQRMVADGDVYYVRPTQQARGDHAVYEAASDTATFTGNVVVAGDENVIRGETLVLHIKGGTSTLRPSGGERVRGVFRPREHAGQAAQNP